MLSRSPHAQHSPTAPATGHLSTTRATHLRFSFLFHNPSIKYISDFVHKYLDIVHKVADTEFMSETQNTEMMAQKVIGDFTLSVRAEGKTFQVVVVGGPIPRVLASRFSTEADAVKYLSKVSSRSLMERGF